MQFSGIVCMAGNIADQTAHIALFNHIIVAVYAGNGSCRIYITDSYTIIFRFRRINAANQAAGCVSGGNIPSGIHVATCFICLRIIRRCLCILRVSASVGVCNVDRSVSIGYYADQTAGDVHLAEDHLFSCCRTFHIDRGGTSIHRHICAACCIDFSDQAATYRGRVILTASPDSAGSRILLQNRYVADADIGRRLRCNKTGKTSGGDYFIIFSRFSSVFRLRFVADSCRCNVKIAKRHVFYRARCDRTDYAEETSRARVIITSVADCHTFNDMILPVEPGQTVIAHRCIRTGRRFVCCRSFCCTLSAIIHRYF